MINNFQKKTRKLTAGIINTSQSYFKKEISSYLLIFITVIIVYLPLVKYGGFHNQDDFHFFRKYSLTELVQSWYSNYNFTGIESNGYRPLAIWINHFLYIILGFNEVPFMVLIVILNALFALSTYRLARFFLDKYGSIFAAILSVILPQSLFRFTWATEIPNTICFILIINGYVNLLIWFRRNNNHYLIRALIFGVIASLIKEVAYSFFLAIPLVMFIKELIYQKKINFSIIKKKAFILPPLLIITLITVRHFALRTFPLRLNLNYPDFHIEFTNDFFLDKLHLFEKQLVYILNPTYLTFLKNIFDKHNINEFILFAFTATIILLAINKKIFKTKLVTIAGIIELFFILLYLLVKLSYFCFLFFQLFPLYTLLFSAYYYGFYFLSICLLFEFIKNKKFTHYLLLFLFLVVSLIPVIFIAAERTRPVSNSISLIIVFLIINFIRKHYLDWSIVKFSFALLSTAVTCAFSIKVFAYILTDTNKYSMKSFYRCNLGRDKSCNSEASNRWTMFEKKYNLQAQMAYADKYLKTTGFQINNNDAKVLNGSFESGIKNWIEPGDCSAGRTGNPIFKIGYSKEATDGKTSLALISENHILCISAYIKNLKTNKNYNLTFDAKKVEGDFEPDFYIVNIPENNFHTHTSDLAHGWKKYTVFFTPTEIDPKLYFYSQSEGKKNVVLYDNIKIMEKEGIIKKLVDEYYKNSWPQWIYWPLFNTPKN